ncbi:MAG: hypothetical protein ACI4TJ_07140 [Candidatus Cryptobacteroides sp.]
MNRFETFIKENAKADPAQLVLSTREWPENPDPVLSRIDARDLAVNTISAIQKLEKKAPLWAGTTGLVFATRLSAEQCSSEKAAEYKAGLVQRILEDKKGSQRRIADLTGGLGVDSLAFSRIAGEVLYNEMDGRLAAAARHNFPVLKAKNIKISSVKVGRNGINGVLGGFKPDLIYLDPARRDSSGNKVFLLEECSPDVLSLIPELFTCTRHILLKLSPMADIPMVWERLNTSARESIHPVASKGRCVREIHVTAYDGECKEVLVWMDREYEGRRTTFCVEDGNAMKFVPGKACEGFRGVDSTYSKILFEPGKSFTKAGMFNELCERLGLAKYARFTHLYTIPEVTTEEELLAEAGRLSMFGKVYSVMETLPLCKASIKEIGQKYPECEVTARNLPMSSDELRSKLKVSSGDGIHIFGARIELPSGPGNYLIVTRPVRV